MAALGLFSCLGPSSRFGMTITNLEWSVIIAGSLMLASVFCGAFLWVWSMLNRHLAPRFWLRLAGGLLTAAIAAAFTYGVGVVYSILLYMACFLH